MLWRRGRRLAALLLLIAAVYLIARLDSASAKTAMAGAALTFALVAMLPRSMPSLLAGIAAMSALMLPWAFSQWLAPDAVIQSWPHLAPSAQHRLFIWQFAVERIAEHPWLGWGFDASRALPGGKTMPPIGIEVMPLHPHNSLLQVRLELGLAGAAILAGLIARGVSLAAREIAGPAAGVHAAMLTAYLIVGLFGYGVWQSWWIAAGWLAWAIGQVALAPVTQAKG
jgi:O-antigen ligase